MNEILSFPRTFLYQNVDYVKLTNIQIYTGKRSGEANLGNYQDDISRSTKVAYLIFFLFPAPSCPLFCLLGNQAFNLFP